jgi:hypothetical protein
VCREGGDYTSRTCAGSVDALVVVAVGGSTSESSEFASPHAAINVLT